MTTTIINTPRGPVAYPYNLSLVDFLAVAISNGWRLAGRNGRLAMVES